MLPSEAAFRYAAVGWATFPLTPAKLPYPQTHGHLDATLHEPDLRKMFRGREAGLGIACGDVSGLLVVDVDEKSGRSGTETLRQRGEELPKTFTVRTPSGGHHHYYRCPPGARSRNDFFGGGCGLDVKANGGYVAAWPTPGYQVAGKVADWAPRLPAPPAWAVIFRREREEWSGPFRGREPTDGELVDLSETLALVGARLGDSEPGQRNDLLNKMAFGLFLLVVDGYLEKDAAVSTLYSGALASGLEEKEVRWTLRSALRGAQVAREEHGDVEF